jgi:fructosamine-3-kinase
MTDWSAIARHLTDVTGERFGPGQPRGLGGGCINTAVKLEDGHRAFFVKLNRAALLDMFEAEEQGLREMAATGTIRVPQPVCSGTAGGQAYLVMEYVEMGGSRGDGAGTAGRQLAAMHRHTRQRFGWDRDNTIGSTPQPNDPDPDWVRFWRERRLGFQLELAGRNGHRGDLQRRGEALLDRFPALMEHAPVPSLMHGDLWGGNIAYTADGEPVVFDPAVYYGDREADLAMTELFGSFGARFYEAYNEAWPLDAGYRVRKTLYNLYHVLNHLNLFGGGYLGQARGMIDRLLAEIG